MDDTPERSVDLAGEIRRNRERLGLSHARLAELVGRSPATVRSWERGAARPEDADVLRSLAAVLGLDEASVFAAAGLDTPTRRRAPSVSQALERLGEERPSSSRSAWRDLPPIGGELTDEEREMEDAAADRKPSQTHGTAGDSGDDVDRPSSNDVGRRGAHVRPPASSSSLADTMSPVVERVREWLSRPPPQPRRASSTSSAGSGPLTTLPQRPPDPSYLESQSERLSYRARSLMTAVGVGLAFIVFAWAASNFFEALGSVWDVLTSGF